MRLLTRLTVASILALASSTIDTPSRADGVGATGASASEDPGSPPADSQDSVPPVLPAPTAMNATREPGAASAEPVDASEDIDPGFPPSDSQDNVPPKD
jgi:hypothetical protein